MSIHSSDCDCNAKRLERELGAWRTSEFDNSGTASGISRSRLSEIQDSSWIGSCVDGLDGATLCMGRKQFPSEGDWENALSFHLGQGLQVKGHWRTPYRSLRCKDYTGEVVPFGEVYLGRNRSEDGAKLNMKWMRGVSVGKIDRTDEFLLLTSTGAMKTRCVRRLEGDNAWDVQFLNLCVGTSKSMSWKVADVRKECIYILDKPIWKC